LNLPTEYEGLPFTLILDGRVDYHALSAAGLDYTWLQQQLRTRGFDTPQQVLLATLETSGRTHFYPREQRSSPR
jgi:uncharacterized membrane protein YcaP (DUF421 family)